MHLDFLTTAPIWLLPFIRRLSPDDVYAPLSDPRGWSASMGSPGCRLALLALLVILVAIWASGRGGPPRGRGRKFSTASDPENRR